MCAPRHPVPVLLVLLRCCVRLQCALSACRGRSPSACAPPAAAPPSAPSPSATPPPLSPRVCAGGDLRELEVLLLEGVAVGAAAGVGGEGVAGRGHGELLRGAVVPVAHLVEVAVPHPRPLHVGHHLPLRLGVRRVVPLDDPLKIVRWHVLSPLCAHTRHTLDQHTRTTR
eukprot:2530814-Rhodomonas_salina.5